MIVKKVNKFLFVTAIFLVCSFKLLSQLPDGQIKKVHLIFKTHLDIGFTDLSSQVERRYIEEFIPNTLKIIEQLRAEQAEERYVWTTGSWLVWEYLQQASPEAVKKFEEAIRRGDIVWNGVPYTVESEIMNRELFATSLKRSQQLDRRFGKTTVAAKMTDVPGHTRSIITPLCDAGITMLHIGVNSSSALPGVPPVCRWRNTDGKEIVLVYQGDYGEEMVLPDGETVLSIHFTGDNHGPHSIEKIKEIYAAAKAKYPHARIAATSLNEVANDLRTMMDKIPVVTSEIGDTWIYGFGTSPLRIARYRALSRLYTRWLQNGTLDSNAPVTIDFAVRLGLVAEHTWGLDVKTHLQHWDKYDVDPFHASRALPEFRRIERSWAEVDEYVDQALALLPHALQQEAGEALKQIENPATLRITGHDPPPQLNEKGAYRMSVGGMEAVIGELAYLTFSAEDYVNYRNTYSRHQEWWVLGDFGKPGLENSKAKSATVVASMENCKVTKEENHSVVQCNLQFSGDHDLDPRVFPETTTIEYTIPAPGNKIDIKLTFHNKPAVRLPEAYMLSFVPSGIQRILAEKMGFMVDVADVVPGGNRQMHAIDHHIDIMTDKGTIRITSLDAPLAAIGERNMLNYSKELPDLSQGVHFCLFNNLWGTNFSMWWGGSITYRFTVELLAAASCTAPERFQICDLRCENLTHPLGIDATAPRLSWKISTDRHGVQQQAYQILAATDSLLLEEGKADLWDSGQVESPASVMVPYRGKALQARSCVYWKVGVWDEESSLPVWSKASFFSVGLLAPTDRTGYYIGMPKEAGNPESPLLRKQFELADLAEKTFLHLNSLGYHEVYMNGAKVGDDVLSPSVSQFDKRSQVVTYDVSPYLRQGSNDLVIWLGRGWYQPGFPGVVYEGPLVKAQLETLNHGKWDTLLATNATWKCRESGYTGIGSWWAGHFGGERVDADTLPDDLTTSTLDALTWIAAQEIDVPPHAVSPRMTEPNRIKEKVRPVKISHFGKDSIQATPVELHEHHANIITPAGKDHWLVDMGKALTGWVEIDFPPFTQGEEIVMQFFDHFANGQPVNQGQMNRYIASGKNGERFKNKFNYHGFRYILISNLPVQPSLDDIHAYLIHTDFKEASSFQCSDPDMNAIHDMIQHAFRCLSLGGYIIDCPQIERLGYGGDGNACTQTAQTMFNLSPLYANWMQAWADCIHEEGGMPHTAPNPYPAGGGPYWCGFIITASWSTYVNYGDSRLIEKYYPVMQQWLGYVQKHTVDGLLKQWPDTNYRQWYLGDWATPEGVDQTAQASVELVNNCFISVCYATMEKIAGFLGKTEDAAAYAAKNEQLKKRIHERFFDSTGNGYATNSQIDLIYPMLAQVTPESLIPAVTRTLFTETGQNKDGHLATGLVGITVLTEWAIRNRAVDWVYGMLKKRGYPGYLYMLDNGATATWEHWNGVRSQIHNCYNGIGSWFYQAVGGIRPDENVPGYRRFIIAPQVPAGITWANVSKETPYGTITVDWIHKEKMLHLNLTVPPGCRALLELPETVSDYTVDGKKYVNTDWNEISSGQYRIVYRYLADVK